MIYLEQFQNKWILLNRWSFMYIICRAVYVDNTLILSDNKTINSYGGICMDFNKILVGKSDDRLENKYFLTERQVDGRYIYGVMITNKTCLLYTSTVILLKDIRKNMNLRKRLFMRLLKPKADLTLPTGRGRGQEVLCR